MAHQPLLTQFPIKDAIDDLVDNLGLYAEIDRLLSDEQVHLSSSGDTTSQTHIKCDDVDSSLTSFPVVVEQTINPNVTNKTLSTAFHNNVTSSVTKWVSKAKTNKNKNTNTNTNTNKNINETVTITNHTESSCRRREENVSDSQQQQQTQPTQVTQPPVERVVSPSPSRSFVAASPSCFVKSDHDHDHGHDESFSIEVSDLATRPVTVESYTATTQNEVESEMKMERELEMEMIERRYVLVGEKVEAFLRDVTMWIGHF